MLLCVSETVKAGFVCRDAGDAEGAESDALCVILYTGDCRG